MGINIILVIVGLVICFGGIYLRRICSGFLGLICGVLGAFAFALVTVGLWHIGDDSTILAIIICGVLCGVISAVYYKVCAAISSFLSAFTFMLLFFAVAGGIDSETGIITAAAIVALIIAGISIKFYDYSFIITSALMGAFAASVGGFGLIRDCSLEDILITLLWSGYDNLTPILIATIVLAVIGFFVQLRRLKLIRTISNGADKRNNYDREQFSRAAATVSEHTKKFREVARPVFQDANNQATEIWKEVSTANGRAVLKEEILKEKALFIAPLVAFFLFPLIEKFAGYGGFHAVINWVRNIASAISIGTLIYFILKKDSRFSFLYTLIYTGGYLLFILFNTYLLRYMFWYTLIELLRYLILWIVLNLIVAKIKNEEVKPVILLFIGVVLDVYILTWLAQRSIYLFFTFYTFVYLAVAFATVYLLFKTRDYISIIAFNSVQGIEVESDITPGKSASPPNTKGTAKPEFCYCPNCGTKLINSDPFCSACGKRVK